MSCLKRPYELPFARFTVHHNFEVKQQFAGRVIVLHVCNVAFSLDNRYARSKQ
jgi:hypothetical protein